MTLLVDIAVLMVFWLSVAGILYTYFGYPVLIGLLARLRPPARFEPPAGEWPSVTLLIAAYNEEETIEKKIQNSLAIDYPRDRLQILIVTDGSSDRTPDLVKHYADQGVELLHQPERQGKIAAINRAVPYARGEITVFSDANNMYRPDTIRRLVVPFSDPQVGGVSGAKFIEKGDGSLGESEGLYWKYESFIKAAESRLGSCTSTVGEILAIRRELFRPAPGHIINDDFFLAMQILRQGYRMAYVPEAISTEHVSLSAQDEVVRRTRIVAGRYQAIAMARHLLPWKRPLLVWQIASHKFLRPLVPFFMIGALLANAWAVWWPPGEGFWRLGRPYGLILFGLQGMFYLLAWIGRRFERAEKRWARLLYLPAFLVNSNLAALRGLFRYLRGGQLNLWERVRRC